MYQYFYPKLFETIYVKMFTRFTVNTLRAVTKVIVNVLNKRFARFAFMEFPTIFLYFFFLSFLSFICSHFYCFEKYFVFVLLNNRKFIHLKNKKKPQQKSAKNNTHFNCSCDDNDCCLVSREYKNSSLFINLNKRKKKKNTKKYY